MLKKNDIILAVTVIAACIFMIVIYTAFGKTGGAVHISVNGYECAVLPLNENIVMRVPETGRSYNVVVIKDGRVSVGEADCPDGLCVNQGGISSPGETIICLPHKLMVTVSGETKGILNDDADEEEYIDGKTY